ncbi:MAG TPA: DinB family protein [Chitinophagaceae bacterium]|nr:DinB family protein [Chitinophagaceae bacterium]
MKIALAFCLLVLTCRVKAQNTPVPTLKSILLEQLKTTHNVEDWFVPVNIAIAGLTPEQAAWKDSSTNHSIAQLVNHLIFWDMEQLAKFKGEKPPAFNGDNTTTFTGLDKTAWDASVKRIDSVLTAFEAAIEQADDTKLQQWYNAIAHVGTHNAYHIGQIIYIRKMRGNWNADKGVK